MKWPRISSIKRRKKSKMNSKCTTSTFKIYSINSPLDFKKNLWESFMSIINNSNSLSPIMRTYPKIESHNSLKITPTKYSTLLPVSLIITRTTPFFSKIDPFLTIPRTSNKTTSKGPTVMKEKPKTSYKKTKVWALPMIIICLLNKKRIFNSKITLPFQRIPPLTRGKPLKVPKT